MKKSQNQQNQENLKLNNTRNLIISYTDNVIRGLISFLIIGIGSYIFLIGFLKIRVIYVLPFVFIVSILFTPIFSKIKLGEILLNQYDEWIKKTFKI
jgi:hypothetical protein